MLHIMLMHSNVFGGWTTHPKNMNVTWAFNQMVVMESSPFHWVWALYYPLSMVIKKCEHDYITHQTARGTTFSDRPELNSEAKHNLTWLQPQDRITLGTFRDATSWARNQKAIPKCIVPDLCCTTLIHQ